jgi:hypothetical protein
MGPGRAEGRMRSRAVAACLLAFALTPTCIGIKAAAKAKAKAKTKDPWDVPDGSEEVEPAGNMESEMSPDDQAGILQQVEARSAMRRANSQHAVMKQFMNTFANNMRLSVLADSKGDMPEEERQRLIAKAEAAKEGSTGEPAGDSEDAGPGFGPPPAQADEGDEMAPPPPPPRRQQRHRMLNMAEARHRQRQAYRRPHARLLPEAEGIGFPAPEGMASDPASEGMVSDPGSAAPSFDAPSQYAAAPVPHPHRHHLHMLNARPGEIQKAHRHHTSRRDDHEPPVHKHVTPPGVVRDEMGRAMPLLSFGQNPGHSGVGNSAYISFPLAAIVCFFLAA